MRDPPKGEVREETPGGTRSTRPPPYSATGTMQAMGHLWRRTNPTLAQPLTSGICYPRAVNRHILTAYAVTFPSVPEWGAVDCHPAPDSIPGDV